MPTDVAPVKQDVAATFLPALPVTLAPSEPLPDWLADEESLRDEGVLFGLSDARPDGKVAQIRAFFGQQSAPLEESIHQYTEQIGEINQFINERETRIATLRHQLDELRNAQPASTNLIRTAASLLLLEVMCVGTFFLVDETLRPAFPNRWVAVGVFLAGMFNLAGRTSFFYETGTRLTARRLIEEVGLPLAASVFILVQALETKSTVQAVGLFLFVFFLFLLGGKLLLTTLTSLQNDINVVLANRRLLVRKQEDVPRLEAEINQLVREVDGLRTQKWPFVTSLNQTEARRVQLNTQRDRLVNLFISEFELARSLRERLPESQREAMFK
ncbi:hypothetical protein [Spirosoma profusum]|nr:hypothetical protein [Spirosoma profusum]